MPENTMVAFRHALACGADGLELDVRLSRDDVPLVIHDAGLDRTTNMVGPVGARTADELAAADAAYHFRQQRGYPGLDDDIGVPRLVDVLTAFPRIPIIIELKEEDPRLAGATLEAISAADAEARVCIGSFFDRALAHVRRLRPHVVTSAGQNEVKAALRWSYVGLPLFGASYRSFQVPVEANGHRVVTRRFVAACHLANRGVHVWTVNDAREMKELLALGVDALISDRPDLAVSIVDLRARQTV